MTDKPKIHRGNDLIRGHNTKYSFTKEELLEYKKCKEDPIYFITNYVYIISLDEGKVLFKLYDFQKEMILTYINKDRVVCLSGRQMGKCTVFNTCIKIRSCYTGEVRNISIGEFHEMQKKRATGQAGNKNDTTLCT